ncbi:DUF1648 domain-containing protein [Nonomuraea sp. SYSU D8015]|uniref:DUF1648 domain-containing protein n=1 Tax=Nonomuraea sp. SYSU D8015 TaxID=2593644 RepID=UPI001660C8AF|nr:DUF1648 domain-containing protein [Nonomuraea sp. SYSU D8015]
MNPRLAAISWGLLVTAVQVLLPMAVRDRLPDPLATHWGPGGVADGHMSFLAYLAMAVTVWGVPWLAVLGAAVRGRVPARRQGRMFCWGLLAGMGVFAAGMNATTVLANLDAPHWSAARLPGWGVPAVIGAMLAAAVLAGRFGRGAPDPAAPPGRTPPRLRLRAGQRAVWVGHVANPWLGLTAAVAGAAIALLAVLHLAGVVPGGLAASVLPGPVLILVLGLLTSSLSVHVSDDRVVIRFGPLGRPARRIPISKIRSAWSEERSPSGVGGWGVRGLPGSATIMLRGGECLVLGYRGGGQLAISIDDATRGASLINALIAERVEP